MSTGRAQAACSDPIAGCGGLQGESLLVDGALRIRAHLHGEQRQGHGERGWWPWELGRSSRLPCKRQQALAGSKLDCGWQGALAHRQLAVAVAAHLIFYSSPGHHPTHRFFFMGPGQVDGDWGL